MMTKRESQKLIEDMKPELDERAAAWKCGAALFIVWLIALIGAQTSIEPSNGPHTQLGASRAQVSASAAPGAGTVQSGTQQDRAAQSE